MEMVSSRQLRLASAVAVPPSRFQAPVESTEGDSVSGSDPKTETGRWKKESDREGRNWRVEWKPSFSPMEKEASAVNIQIQMNKQM